MSATSNNRSLVLQLAKNTFGRIGGAAVVGNIFVETGGSFDYQQRQSGGGPGYGLFQMENPMHNAYDAFMNTNHLTDSAESQMKFAQNEVEHGSHIGAGNTKKIRDAFAGNDVKNATEVFCNIFEKPSVPHMDRRIAAAQEALNEM